MTRAKTQSEIDLGIALQARIAEGNTRACDALVDLLKFEPCGGWPSNVRPLGKARRESNASYIKAEGLTDAPFFTEAFLYNLVGKEDARTILGLLDELSRALGYEGSRDLMLRRDNG